MPSVNPDILRWARETAGLSVQAAASKLSFNDTKRTTGAARLTALESGASEPDESVLARMAKAYRRPLLSFYLPAPPPADNTSHDFRTLPDRSSGDEPVIATLLRGVKTSQSLVRSLLEDEDHPPLQFVGSMKGGKSVAVVLESIVATTEISLEHFRAEKTPDAAFNYLRQKFERAGIFVVLLGNLGTHHTNIDVKAFRGIALADSIAPFIVINDQDSKAAWSFTLLHEACHIWLGESGISAFASELASEKFCNDVASSFLLPEGEISSLQMAADVESNSMVEAISRFAQPRNLSMTMVAFRLYRANVITSEQWLSLADRFRMEWRLQKEREKEVRKSKDSAGGPNYYVVRRFRLGKALVETAYRGITEGSLSATKAGKILGVAPRSVYSLLNPANGRAA